MMSGNVQLRGVLRVWIMVVVLELAALGLVSVIRPEWYRSTAYDFASDLISIEAWGVVFSLLGVMLIVSLVRGARAYRLLRMALGLHAVCQVVWGASIFALTLSGRFGAIAGAFQWWMVGGVSLFWVGSPLTVHRSAQRSDG